MLEKEAEEARLAKEEARRVKEAEIEVKREARRQKTAEIMKMKQLQKRNPAQFKKLMKEKIEKEKKLKN
jgi:hypothetical protein